jgi:catechol 2,3-dioxygenase-like lactoylglutathione lyase family enzyme
VLDHVGVNVSDFAAARSFYVAALEPLAIRPVMEFEGDRVRVRRRSEAVLVDRAARAGDALGAHRLRR